MTSELLLLLLSLHLGAQILLVHGDLMIIVSRHSSRCVGSTTVLLLHLELGLLVLGLLMLLLLLLLNGLLLILQIEVMLLMLLLLELLLHWTDHLLLFGR